MRRPLVDLSSLVLVHITLVVYIYSLIGIYRHDNLTNIRVDSVLFISANIFIGSEMLLISIFSSGGLFPSVEWNHLC